MELRDFAERVLFATTLEGVVENPNRRVSEIPLFTAEEQSRILREWNDTAAPYPAELGLDGLFEAQVRRTPDRVAVHRAGRKVKFLNATGVSDGRYYADDGIEIINFGPGSGAQGHAANESVPIAEMVQAAQIQLDVVRRLLM